MHEIWPHCKKFKLGHNKHFVGILSEPEHSSVCRTTKVPHLVTFSYLLLVVVENSCNQPRPLSVSCAAGRRTTRPVGAAPSGRGSAASRRGRTRRAAGAGTWTARTRTSTCGKPTSEATAEVSACICPEERMYKSVKHSQGKRCYAIGWNWSTTKFDENKCSLCFGFQQLTNVRPRCGTFNTGVNWTNLNSTDRPP